VVAFIVYLLNNARIAADPALAKAQ
jgi:hypothetical protein